MALFDVIMPVKNGATYIEAAIQSVRSQTETDWRLLVLDHGSTDDTPAIVDKLAGDEKRIEYHLLPHAQGLSGLLNEGLALASAPYAMRMDADDECLPERMALTRQAFEQHPDVVVVGGQAQIMDESGRTVGIMRNPCDRAELARRAMFRSAFIHPAMCFRAQSVNDMGLSYGRSIFRHRDPLATIEVPNLAEDYLLFSELAIDGLALNVPQEVLRYRMHAGGVSRQKYADQLRKTAEISRHLGAVLSRRVGLQPFDPVPFCTHAQALLDVQGSSDYRNDHAHMSHVLAQVGGAWAAGQRELQWRSVFVDRRASGLIQRAVFQGLRCQPDQWERRTVLYAVKNILRGRPRMRIDDQAHAGHA